jgi:hypothetical protein
MADFLSHPQGMTLRYEAVFRIPNSIPVYSCHSMTPWDPMGLVPGSVFARLQQQQLPAKSAGKMAGKCPVFSSHQ